MVTSSFDPISNKPILVHKTLRCQCCSPIKLIDTGWVESLNSNYPVDLTALEENFRLRHEVSIDFSSKVNDITTREAVNQFQVNIDNV